MSHGDEVRAIHARDDLSMEEKRELTYRVKGRAFHSLRQAVKEPWTDGDLTLRITNLRVDAQHRVLVDCEAWRGDVPLVLDLPFIYVNPPLIHKGEESPLAVLKHIVAETARLFD